MNVDESMRTIEIGTDTGAVIEARMVETGAFFLPSPGLSVKFKDGRVMLIAMQPREIYRLGHDCIRISGVTDEGR